MRPMEPRPPPEIPAKPHMDLDASRNDPKSLKRWDAASANTGNGATRGAGSSAPSPHPFRGDGGGKKGGSLISPPIP